MQRAVQHLATSFTGSPAPEAPHDQFFTGTNVTQVMWGRSTVHKTYRKKIRESWNPYQCFGLPMSSGYSSVSKEKKLWSFKCRSLNPQTFMVFFMLFSIAFAASISHHHISSSGMKQKRGHSSDQQVAESSFCHLFFGVRFLRTRHVSTSSRSPVRLANNRTTDIQLSKIWFPTKTHTTNIEDYWFLWNTVES